MVTIIVQPNQILHVSHESYLEVRDCGDNAIMVSYKDKCNTCAPVMYEIHGEGDLYVEITTKFD